MVIKIATQRKIISTKAAAGDLKPKKKTDQRMLRNNCTPNQTKGTLFFLAPFTHIKYKEIPIKTNKVIQTGEKIQLGGLKAGLLRLTYQVDTQEVVKKEPITPAN